MIRRLPLIAVLILAVALTSCQSYTSGLQKSLARADETVALALLHNIALAERTYSLSNSGEYATLKQLADGGFIDARYAGERPVKDYIITLNVTGKADGAAEGSYTCNADPENSSERPGRHLYIDSTSDGIHVNDTQPATASDKLLQ